MSDMVTVRQVRDWPPGKLLSLPIEQHALAADLAEMKAVVAEAEARLSAGLDLKFADRARQLRAAEGKDSCRVRLGDGLFVMVADLDQDKLAAIVARIQQSGDDPSEYVRTTFEVTERTHSAWPSWIGRPSAAASVLDRAADLVGMAADRGECRGLAGRIAGPAVERAENGIQLSSGEVGHRHWS